MQKIKKNAELHSRLFDKIYQQFMDLFLKKKD